MAHDDDNSADVQRTLGGLLATQREQRMAHRDLKMAVESIDGKMDRVLLYLERQKGARRATLAIASGLSTAAGAVAAVAVQWFTSGGAK
jgi:hypothetical protein